MATASRAYSGVVIVVGTVPESLWFARLLGRNRAIDFGRILYYFPLRTRVHKRCRCRTKIRVCVCVEGDFVCRVGYIPVRFWRPGLGFEI
jgi:hypothetical protein